MNRCLPTWVAFWLSLSSVICLIDGLFIILRPHTLPGGKWNYLFKPYNIYIEVDTKYKDLKDGFVIGQSWMNLVEVFLNIIALLLHNKGKRVSVVLAFMVSTMTFAKTVLYFLLGTDLCHGDVVKHNDWVSLIVLYIIPNGIWIVFPFLSVLALGRKILDHLENNQESGKRMKSN